MPSALEQARAAKLAAIREVVRCAWELVDDTECEADGRGLLFAVHIEVARWEALADAVTNAQALRDDNARTVTVLVDDVAAALARLSALTPPDETEWARVIDPEAFTSIENLRTSYQLHGGEEDDIAAQINVACAEDQWNDAAPDREAALAKARTLIAMSRREK